MSIDPFFRVVPLAQTPNPQRLIWMAAHQCVSDEPVADYKSIPSEELAGEYVVKHLLAGNRGHWSPAEAPQISFNIINAPHSVMQQLRTHRVAVHFSVMSFRYTGQRIVDVARGKKDVEEVFYLRPVGEYSDRQGSKYMYGQWQRDEDIRYCKAAAVAYAERVISQGFSEEHARSLIPFDVRQHWVMSANVRSLSHIFDLRLKRDAQLECFQICELMYPHFEAWVPAIADWYTQHRKGKARLSP